MSDLLEIFSRVLGVFLIMAAGAFARRQAWLTPDADNSLARLTANVLLPALFVDRVFSSSALDRLAEAWLPPLIGYSTTALGVLLAWSLARQVGPRFGLESDSSHRAFAITAGICNYGYIPLPLAQHFYPAAEVSLILHNVGVDLAMWSVGIWVVAGGGGESSLRRAFLSPAVIAVAGALVLRQSGAVHWIPPPLLQMTEALGECALPIGQVLSGAIIFDFLRRVRWHGALATVSAAVGFRLLLMPLLMLSAAALAPLSTELRQVVLLQAAMPASVFSIVLVRLYDQDTTTGLRVVLSTGLAGVISIPLWMHAGKLWLLP